MTKVNQESLMLKIRELESREVSLKEEYQLAAYRMLLPHAPSCPHEWVVNQIAFNNSTYRHCIVCKECREDD